MLSVARPFACYLRRSKTTGEWAPSVASADSVVDPYIA
jgi:hypothetical protein